MASSARTQRRGAHNGPLLIPSAMTEKLKTVARASAPRTGSGHLLPEHMQLRHDPFVNLAPSMSMESRQDAPSSPSAASSTNWGASTPAASVLHSPRTAAAAKHLSRTRFGARMVEVRDSAIAAAAVVRAEAAAAAALEAEVSKLMSRGATRPQAEALARRRLAPQRLGNGRSLKRLPSQARDIEGDRIQEGVCGQALRAEEGRVTLQVQLSGRPCSC
ncbi:hypothetical protein HYH03_008030 [Edaphochlamys debaryana]|uniref:Uncharacterized protein n=1 Tax=Edaphochlamys debaryana TaxID=47281 RepID=A0A836BYG9_9CHLO|nr:hypothetical protein HYH03_008030 [Edaphochlamys debaryana]|eukprot:KAG2493811.1 hypothetical protein HYH03_008030 [Edaphochlamys debaryana]